MARRPEPPAAPYGRRYRGRGRHGSRATTSALLAAAVIAVVVVLAFVLHGPVRGLAGIDDPFGPFGAGRAAPEQPLPLAPDPERDLPGFLRYVVGDIEQFWAGRFKQAGLPYSPAGVVVFHQVTQSGCGPASAATGPFYCPLDQTVYLDEGFFRELRVQFHAPGDFADAYVVAHELGHHVQNLTGLQQKVQTVMAEDPADRSALSIRLELQADCLAGVWGHSTYQRGLIERGDLEEALRAAAAVGDDRIQKATIGRIDPETWTHGSSVQRRTWYLRGFEAGRPEACDTFAVPEV